jgi:hypothetical protein
VVQNAGGHATDHDPADLAPVGGADGQEIGSLVLGDVLQRSRRRGVADDHAARHHVRLGDDAVELGAGICWHVLLETADRRPRRAGLKRIGTNRDELSGGQRAAKGKGVAAALAIVDTDDGLLEHDDVLR